MRLKILPLFAVIFGILLAGFFATTPNAQNSCCIDNVFLLTGDRRALLGEDYFGGSRDHGIVAVAIIPQEVDSDIVTAAWSYAVQYGADGLYLVNYPRAVEIMQERHPTWTIAITKGYMVGFTDGAHLLDTPEPTLTAIPESTANP